MEIADMDGDGAEEILLAGVNNSYSEVIEEDGKDYGATLVVLDSRRMGGQGPVTGRDDRVIAGAAPAGEKAVLFVRAIEKSAAGASFYYAGRIAVEGDSRMVSIDVRNTWDAPDKPLPFAIFQFDRRLQLTAIQPESKLNARLLAGLPAAAIAADKFGRVRERLGKVKYLKNQFAREPAAE